MTPQELHGIPVGQEFLQDMFQLHSSVPKREYCKLYHLMEFANDGIRTGQR